jgi:hypothetical protein
VQHTEITEFYINVSIFYDLFEMLYVRLFLKKISTDWNQLSERKIRAVTGNTYSFRNRVRKAITSAAK